MMRQFVCMLMVIVPLVGKSQEGDMTDLPSKTISTTYTPNNPEAANFEKYSELPVNHTSGIPDISIPLMTIQTEGYQIPIMIKYHGGGVKVDDVASMVGLGWVLNAGGSININTIDFLDDSVEVWKRPENFDIVYDELLVADPDYGYNFLKSVFGYSADSQAPESFEGLQQNFEVDSYSYHLPNGSGNFIRKKGLVNDFITIPESTITINPDYSIVDQSGVRFEFEEYGYNTTNGNHLNASVNKYLTKIITPQKDTIDFVYEDDNYTYLASKSNQTPILEAFRYEGINQFFLLDNNQIASCKPGDASTILDYTGSTVNGKRIRRITTNNGYRVEFIYSNNERVDLPGTNSLEKIEKFMDLGFESVLISKAQFFYSYDAGSTPDNVFLPPASIDYLKYRMILDSVKIDALPSYRFQYHKPTQNSFPARLSNKQDFWGYANNNESHAFYPKVYQLQIDGGNRKPDPELMGGLNLKKVVYPTGGSVELEFEPKEFAVKDFKKFDEYELYFEVDINESQNFYLEIPETVHAFVRFEYRFHNPTGIVGISDPQFIYPFLPEEYGEIVKEATPIPPGNYIINIDNNFYEPVYDPNTAFLRVIITTGEVLEGWSNHIGGGLRIKRIKELDQHNNILRSRLFQYNIPGTEISSGIPEGVPDPFKHFIQRDLKFYAHLGEETDEVPQPPEGDGGIQCHFCIPCPSVVLRSNDDSFNKRPLGFGIHYTHVTEMHDELGILGKVEYRYSTLKDFYPNLSIDSETIDLTHNVKGQILEEKQYKKEGDFELISEKYYFYSLHALDDNELIENNKFQVLTREINVVIHTKHIFIPAEFKEWTYKIPVVWIRKDSVKTILHEDEISAFKTDHYDYYGHKLVKSKISRHPDSEMITYYQYFGGTDLIRNFTRTKVVQTSNGLKEKLIDAEYVEYKFAFYKPRKISKARLNNALHDFTYPPTLPQESPHTVDLIEIDQIDTKGKPISLISLNGERKSFLWGYHNNFLLAKAINAEPDDIAYSSFETYDKGNWEFDAIGDFEEEAITGRRVLKGINSTISKSSLNPSKVYIISFWAKIDEEVTLNIGHPPQGPVNFGPTNGQWEYFEREFSNIAQMNLVIKNAWVDELRLHPKESLMTTYCYDPKFGVVNQTDPNGIISRFEYYDDLKWLKNIIDHDFNLVTHLKYNHANR